MSVIEMKRPECPWCTTPINPGEDTQGRIPVDINGRLFHAGCVADMQRMSYDTATLEENEFPHAREISPEGYTRGGN